MKLMGEIEKAELELQRLNDLFNFTRQAGDKLPPPLSWTALRYSKLPANNELAALLRAVTVYGALARSAGDASQYYNTDPQWDYTFNSIGERLMFVLPSYLNSYEQNRFYNASAKAFVMGWRGESLPTPT